MKFKNRKGQSTLEYIILVTAVIAVLIVFLNPTTGMFSTTVNASYNQVVNGINTWTNKLLNSWNP